MAKGILELKSDTGRMPLADSLRKYWWALIGIAVYPVFFVFVVPLLALPFTVWGAMFLVVGALAKWPYLGGKAPYLFWLVAFCAFMVSGILAVVVRGALDAVAA